MERSWDNSSESLTNAQAKSMPVLSLGDVCTKIQVILLAQQEPEPDAAGRHLPPPEERLRSG
jgi:hypothetical protein